MPSRIVRIDTRAIKDWVTFHNVFCDVMGFPAFYGRNMDAWVDCMSYADLPEEQMTSVHAPKGGVLVLQLEHAKDFAMRCPEIYLAVIECTAFVNWRLIDKGDEPILALAF